MSNSMKAMRVVRGISQFLCIVLLLLACGALSAQNQEHRVRNIVLVHGAWADGSGWKGVYDILAKDGYNVSIVQEPGSVVQRRRGCHQADTRSSRRTVHSCRSQLWGSRNHGSWDVSIGCRIRVTAAHMPDAGENEADDGKRFPSDLSKSGAIKKINGRFHLHRPHTVS